MHNTTNSFIPLDDAVSSWRKKPETATTLMAMTTTSMTTTSMTTTTGAPARSGKPSATSPEVLPLSDSALYCITG